MEVFSAVAPFDILLMRILSLLFLACCVGFLAPSTAIAQFAAPPVEALRPFDSLDHVDQRPRNIILLIGDGMGPQQVGLLLAYVERLRNQSAEPTEAAIERMMHQGKLALVKTAPHDALVVDSAAAATQLASGRRAGSEMIGVDYQGNRAETVVEVAESVGRSTGLVSDTRITHATPAAFAAHQPHRTMENEIAEDLLASGVDVLLSGGLRHWVPQAVNDRESPAYLALIQMTGGQFPVSSRRQDNRNLLLEARRGHQLVFDRSSLLALDEGRVLGLFANSEMYDSLTDRNVRQQGENTQPTLAEMTRKAIDLLSDDPDGFFLMVEGGQIDWAGHNNDAGTMLVELLQFDEAIGVALDWASQREDTLVLVTADHETGGFSFSYSGQGISAPRRLGGDVFRNRYHEPNFNFAAPQVLDSLEQQRKSFYQIFSEFDALRPQKQRPEVLMEMVNAAVAPFSITLQQATDILTRQVNPNFVEGHPYLGDKTVPAMPDLEAFYVYGNNLRMNRLGHFLAPQQSVVWSTGTHTNTPVPLVSYGPGAEHFGGLLHATDVGQRMIELLDSRQEPRANR